MKLDEFSKYKKLIESDGFIPNEEAEKVYRWMEETGRLDEGFFGAVWKWLKRNFSIKARKIHSLADEYEKELIEETRAEYNAMKSKQDLAAKFRKAWTGRLSHDIRERMDIIAGDDNDYRELVRTLVNKKNLIVRKMMIKEFTGQLDPDDVRTFTSEAEKEEVNVNKDYNNSIRKLVAEDAPKFRSLSNFMQKKIDVNSRMFNQIGISDRDSRGEFVAMMIGYVKQLSSKIDRIKYDNDSIWEIAKQYVKLVKEIIDKISDDLTTDEKAKAVKDSLDSLIQDDVKKNQVKPLDSYRSPMQSEVKKNIDKIKEKKSGKEEGKEKDEEKDEEDTKSEVTAGDLPKSVVTPDSEEVSDVDVDSTVKDAVDAAKDETSKKNPTPKEVTVEITDSVRSYFNKNADEILLSLKNEVEDFNKKSDDEKKKIIGKFEYTVDDKNMLAVPTMDDLKLLLEDFIRIAGKIVPYYEYGEKSARYASIAVAEKIFQIYAVKKNLEKKLSDEDIDNIVNAIKSA